MRPFNLARHWLLGVAALLATGLPAASPPASPSDEECAAFGREIAAMFETKRTRELVARMDFDEFSRRVANGMGFSPEDERSFSAGMREGLLSRLAKQYEVFPAARFLRLQHVNNETRALVRLVSEEGAVNYSAFVCFRAPNGRLRWSDIYLYLTGQTLSQSSRQAALPLIAQSKKGLIERLTGTESAYVTNFPKFQQAVEALQAGDAAKTWNLCEQMPREVQQDRHVLVLRLRAAQALDDPKYLKVIEDWAAVFPNDPTLHFVSIDGSILRKDYAAAIEHVTAFSAQIGGDVYLDYLASNALLMAKRYDEARKAARAVLVAEPGLTQALDTLLSISLETKNHAETVALLDEVGQRFPQIDLERDIIVGEPYADFRRSQAYLEWSRRHAAPKKE